MSLLPVVPWPLLLVLAVAGLAAVWWNPSSRTVPGESRATHWRLTAAVLLLGGAAVRPAVPGEQVDTTAANLNVYFVVDTTSSIIAEDYGDQDPAVVAGELCQAATTVADRYDRVPDDGWDRRGLRSNGSEFTVATIAVYHLHDIVHHAWDVSGTVSLIH